MDQTNLYKNKYKIKSSRRPDWDYGTEASYFITICTQNHSCYFGDIVNGQMALSEMGLIVHDEWLKTPMIRPDMHILLDAFVIMPDHFHAIITIGHNTTDIRDAMHRVSNIVPDNRCNKFGPQSKNLASVIRGFKSAVTTRIKKQIPECMFCWQRLYHERRISDELHIHLIRQYIIDNPTKWELSRGI